jgi:hypothetical protein
MKLILQIATGIVLATGVLRGAEYGYHEYEVARDSAEYLSTSKWICESKALSEQYDPYKRRCGPDNHPIKP